MTPVMCQSRSLAFRSSWGFLRFDLGSMTAMAPCRRTKARILLPSYTSPANPGVASTPVNRGMDWGASPA
jgi:hypothetical protein